MPSIKSMTKPYFLEHDSIFKRKKSYAKCLANTHMTIMTTLLDATLFLRLEKCLLLWTFFLSLIDFRRKLHRFLEGSFLRSILMWLISKLTCQNFKCTIENIQNSPRYRIVVWIGKLEPHCKRIRVAFEQHILCDFQRVFFFNNSRTFRIAFWNY